MIQDGKSVSILFSEKLSRSRAPALERHALEAPLDPDLTPNPNRLAEYD